MSSQPLLPAGSTEDPVVRPRRGRVITVVAPIVLVLATIGVLLFGEKKPRDPVELAKYYLKHMPVIDGHVDLPIMVREAYRNDINAFDLRAMPGHVDIPRIRAGHLGGFFWSVFTECHAEADGPDFVNPSYHVRDTLEQIDVSLNLMEKYSDTFTFVKTAAEAEAAIAAGKVAGFMGIEGAHQLGNSLGGRLGSPVDVLTLVLRQYYNLGVRYATLTHSCNNAFADSGGFQHEPNATWHGLSPLGQELIKEMNRLGMLIDLSHVSDKTALQAIKLSKAPVMFSHSAPRHFNPLSRNVPDEILDKIGTGKKQRDGVVMVNFFPRFASADPDEVDVKRIADLVDYLGNYMGRQYVGIGSDFDGIDLVPKGLEDVSKYPYLFAELIKRGWTRHELGGLAGGNILRVLKGAEEVAAKLQRKQGPNMALYSKRTDI